MEREKGRTALDVGGRSCGCSFLEPERPDKVKVITRRVPCNLYNAAGGGIFYRYSTRSTLSEEKRRGSFFKQRKEKQKEEEMGARFTGCVSTRKMKCAAQRG